MNLAFLATIAALLPTIAPTTLMRTVAEGADSPIHERTDVVVKTPDEWKALLTRFAPARTPEPVDFEREMIVGVFAGPRPSTGYRAEVFSVAREGGTIVVLYRVLTPTKDTVRQPISTAPYHLVAVPCDRRRVKFAEVRDLGP